MADTQNPHQIIRKDGRNCFVESLSDSFNIGKAHFVFASYDLKKPAGQRQTNNINIYVGISELLELCRKMQCGELRYVIQQKRTANDSTPIQQWLGGTSAEKLCQYGKARPDGKSLSRTAQLSCGNKSEFLFSASSGPGEQTDRGLIVPRFGKNPENHVSIGMTWEALSEFFLLTKAHYEAWLSAWYITQMRKENQQKTQPQQGSNPQTPDSTVKMF